MLVIKIGGSIIEKADPLAKEIAKLKERFVIVHGGGPQVSNLEKALGRKPVYIYSKEGFESRYVDEKTINNLVMVIAGGMNSYLVQELRRKGVNAVGISSINGIIFAKRKTLISYENNKEKIIRDSYTGKITRVDTKLLNMLLDNGFTPVIAPIGLGEEFEPLNVDGDRAAAAVASALKASKLLLLTDVEGFYSNFPKDLVSSAKQSQIKEFQKVASKGMKRKLVAVDEALTGGVGEVIICCGTKKEPIESALSGSGTHFKK